MFQQIVELRMECGVGLRRAIFPFQIKDQRHQRFGDVTAAELAEMAPLVRLVHEGVYGSVHIYLGSVRVA
jgi:hypothetical protein